MSVRIFRFGATNSALLLYINLLATFIWSQELFGRVHFTLQSALSENNLPLSSQNSRSGSASIAFDLGTYFRIGYTHRQAINTNQGYVQVTSQPESYQYKMEETHSFSNSLDFTIILYYGRLFVPYIQVGAVKKDYFLVSAVGDDEPTESKISLPPVPNGGVGVGIRLNRNFSLKISLSVSPGLKKTTPDQSEPESVWDTFTSVGISYNI